MTAGQWKVRPWPPFTLRSFEFTLRGRDDSRFTFPPSSHPTLRPLDIRWVQDGDATWLMLRDPLGISQDPLLIPAAAAPLLALCDGARDLATIRSSAELRAGLHSPANTVAKVLLYGDALGIGK
jgi:hypothetical protein